MLIGGVALVLTLVATVPGPPPSDEAVMAYLTSAGSVDATPAFAVSAPGSAAWRYADHFSITYSTRIAAGLVPWVDEIRLMRDGAAEACRDFRDGTEPSCAVFDEFVTTPDGLISSFSINGDTIDGRLGDPSEEVLVGPLTAATRSSYFSIGSGGLVVNVRVTAKQDVELDSGVAAVYITPDGREIPGDDVMDPTTLAEGSSTTRMLFFPGAPVGGHIVWNFGASECCEEYQANVPVPGLGEGVPSTEKT